MLTHTVAQGENLTLIAKKYGYSDYRLIYQHADNSEFRRQRPDPNILYPGDVLCIPEILPGTKTASTGKKSQYRVKSQVKEKLKIKVQDVEGSAWGGIKVKLEVEGELFELELGDDGLIEVEISPEVSTGWLKLFLDKGSENHTHCYELCLNYLDPVEKLSGVQARCNALESECGEVDGVMGDNTEKAVKAFQGEYDLDVDGIPGPLTQNKLRAVFGS